MRIAVTGGSGFLGRHLIDALRARGDDVVAIRRGPGPRRPIWTVDGGFDPPDALSGMDAVINLAGENIGERWTTSRKAMIWHSRVQGTRTVVGAIGRAEAKPKLLVNASAVGYYGDRGDEILTEASEPGTGFLAELSLAWEREAAPATRFGTQVATLRTGLVLAHHGGVLERLVPLFRAGLGGKLGSGRQWMSWIHLDDHIRAVLHVIDNGLAGPVNLTAPEPVTNTAFVRALGRAVGRPAIFVAPAMALRIVFGERAGPLLLHGQRAIPRRLLDSGFSFRFADLPGALADLFGASAA